MIDAYMNFFTTGIYITGAIFIFSIMTFLGGFFDEWDADGEWLTVAMLSALTWPIILPMGLFISGVASFMIVMNEAGVAARKFVDKHKE